MFNELPLFEGLLNVPEPERLLESPSGVDELRDGGILGLEESVTILGTIEVNAGWSVCTFAKDSMEFLLEPLSRLQGAVAKAEHSKIVSVFPIVIDFT